MTASVTFRRAGVALLAAALGFAALPGCGNSSPNKADSKKEEPKGGTPGAAPGDNKGGTPGAPSAAGPTASLGPVDKEAEKAVEGFLRDLGEGKATADALTPALLEAVGKPWELPGDKEKKVSADAARRWLQAVGRTGGFSPSLDRKQAGDAIYWRGGTQSGGAYSVRLLRVGGAWKVDWLALSTVEHKGPIAAASAEDAFGEFAVRSFVETLADVGAMERGARAAILARGMTPPLRAAWAPPFDTDKPQGYDYNPGKLSVKATEYGGGTSAFTVTKAGDGSYAVELTKPTGKKVLTIRLTKGATAGEWLVSEVGEKG